MTTLNISFSREGVSSQAILHGDILCLISLDTDAESKVILRQIHNEKKINEWFFELIKNIDQHPPHFIAQNNNYLEKIDLFFNDSSDDFLEKWCDEVYDYREKHDIKFSFRGCEVPSAIIGKSNGDLYMYYKENGFYLKSVIDRILLNNALLL